MVKMEPYRDFLFRKGNLFEKLSTKSFLLLSTAAPYMQNELAAYVFSFNVCLFLIITQRKMSLFLLRKEYRALPRGRIFTIPSYVKNVNFLGSCKEVFGVKG